MPNQRCKTRKDKRKNLKNNNKVYVFVYWILILLHDMLLS